MNPVHLVAYIDAGTGSYILAAIASGVAGLWFFLRSWASKLKRKVTGQPAPEFNYEDDEDEATASNLPQPQRSDD
jgi:hypothetical protein